MKVLIAAGGTAGHINPALAIAGRIKAGCPEAEIHFAGRRKGMEYDLVTRAGYAFHHIEVNGIQRSLTPKNIARNIAAVWHLALAMPRAGAMLRQLQPDLVIGAGGYVSGPVLQAAARRGIPTAIHEQNAFPGVTNKILAKEVDVVFAASAAAVDRLGAPDKTLVVGNPVRPEVFRQDRAAARKALGAGDRVVLLSFGGSLGARRINEVVADLAAWHTKNRDFLHIHATGSRGVELFRRLGLEKGFAGAKQLQVKEYIQDMPRMLAAADLVISRAGALTLAELEAAGRAAILIPSPNVAENHQYYNALELEKAGAAVVVVEKDLTGEKLIELVDRLTSRPETLAEMGQKARALARPDSLDLIWDRLCQLVPALQGKH
ncbi:MAG TPA: undecaprenyldiphospho-muramoylpentapeptide beta-N-acetylglucosaminyltransferase [Candidatus Anaerofilum excrementigallinarum]|nr:undecaprenyldiphospho-muramoylpentapeptide beta-N-acetylglucosaminyltransferase [Candidatus Anaerofilum excrementigallinarum]